MSPTKKLTLFTRERCHLCEEAHAALERVRARLPFELAVVDLDREAGPEKRALYDWEVPVVELEGRKIMKYRVDERRLERLLSGPE
ncbi:glutaredoxin family protein [Sorangium sp. So ce291]|uniref:glutaredoxin family protein n=1 Tax=Sorangium sp. So ce291 TaxID=3133294 RepID=UPI003F63B8E9